MSLCKYLYFFIATCVCFQEAELYFNRAKNVTMKRLCYTSNGTFMSALHTECFVDKSLFIRSFLTIKWPIILVTAPSRFGKSVLMDMLKLFLEVKRVQIDGNLTPGCLLFKEQNLKIYTKNVSFFHEHCGRYPILYFSLDKVSGFDDEDIENTLKVLVHELFIEHSYLLNSAELDERDKKKILYYTEEENVEGISEYNLRISLKVLTKFMSLHFKKKVIVLIDDYDAPVWQVLNEGFPKGLEKKGIKIINGFIKALLKKNSCVERALINGCGRLSELLTLEANIVKYLRFLGNHRMVRYYGLTTREVKQLLSKFNLTHNYHRVKKFYNGYMAKNGLTMFSLPSVLHYLQFEVFEDFWVDRSGFKSLKLFFAEGCVRKLIGIAIETGNVTVKPTKYLSYNYLLRLKELLNDIVVVSIRDAEFFLQILCDNGYFYQSSYDSHLRVLSLTVPNKEIYYHLCDAALNRKKFTPYHVELPHEKSPII